MLISYADACSLMLENPAPMLYLDTCILLDIVRSPVRNSIDSNSAKLAKSLTAQSNTAQRSLWLVTSATVYKEWQENIEGVLAKLAKSLTAQSNTAQRSQGIWLVTSATVYKEWQEVVDHYKGIKYFYINNLIGKCAKLSISSQSFSRNQTGNPRSRIKKSTLSFYC